MITCQISLAAAVHAQHSYSLQATMCLFSQNCLHVSSVLCCQLILYVSLMWEVGFLSAVYILYLCTGLNAFQLMNSNSTLNLQGNLPAHHGTEHAGIVTDSMCRNGHFGEPLNPTASFENPPADRNVLMPFTSMVLTK